MTSEVARLSGPSEPVVLSRSARAAVGGTAAPAGHPGRHSDPQSVARGAVGTRRDRRKVAV